MHFKLLQLQMRVGLFALLKTYLIKGGIHGKSSRISK